MYDMYRGKFIEYKTRRDINCSVCGKESKAGEKNLYPRTSTESLNNLIDEIKKKED